MKPADIRILDSQLPEQQITDVVPTLLSHLPDTYQVSFHKLRLPAKGQERVVKRPEMDAVVTAALKIRADHGVPFWDAVLLAAEKEPLSLRMQLLDAVGLHQPMAAAEKIVATVREVDHDFLKHLLNFDHRQCVMTMSSLVERESPSHDLHLPMIDFRMKVTPANTDMAVAIVKRLGLAGALAGSGNSYHFYGYAPLLTDKDLRRFLGTATLYAPFVDQRWVGHQLIEGACALRISPGKGFDVSPTVIAWVHPG